MIEEGDIVIGETSYVDDTTRLMYTVMSQVIADLELRSSAPTSVEEALYLREAKLNSQWREYVEMLVDDEKIGQFDKENKWIGKTPEEIAEIVLRITTQEYSDKENIKSQAQIIEAVTSRFDLGDRTNTQLSITRNTKNSIHDRNAYLYLVLYPPERQTDGEIRQREASFPTAMCHTIDAQAILDESLIAKVLEKDKTAKPIQRISINDTEYVSRIVRINKISDEELRKVITTHGRTPLDRLIQSGLRVIDRVRGIKGQHIDPLAVLRDENYAAKYALACHRGIGGVVNERVILPPLK